jgi:hypothetical protein
MWKTQNNDEGDEHPDTARQCVEYKLGEQVSGAHTKGRWKKKEATHLPTYLLLRFC